VSQERKSQNPPLGGGEWILYIKVRSWIIPIVRAMEIDRQVRSMELNSLEIFGPVLPSGEEEA
jgi:hypothetical protein